MVWVVVELHLLVLFIRLEVTIGRLCSCHSTGLSSLWRTIVTTEPLTIHIVVIVLSSIRDVKRLIVVLDRLQLLCILVLVIDSQTISLISCIRYSSWVCTIACQVSQFRNDSLATDVDMLGVLTTLSCNQVWADIEREACRTSVAT